MVEREKSATVQLTVRMKEPLRAALEKAAALRGVSINTEVVNRLEKSSTGERVLEEALSLAYGPEIAALIVIIGQTVRSIDSLSALLLNPQGDEDRGWQRNPAQFDQVVDAINYIFDQLKPTNVNRPQYPDKMALDGAGRRVAMSILDMIAKASKQSPDSAEARLAKLIKSADSDSKSSK